MSSHYTDRLHAAIQAKQTPLCVGLDPRWEALPLALRRGYADSAAGRADAYADFCRRVCDLVADLAPVVKAQSAFFEEVGSAGLFALQQVVAHAHARGLLVILDAKRGDIASTAEAYARAAFETYDADAVTINPYLGRDSVEPFLRLARKLGRGVYVLVRTSNPGAGQFQDLVCDGKPLHQHVASEVTAWAGENRGASGYGNVGAVVGATSRKELTELRRLLLDVPLLVPGYGAQGGTAGDVRAAFDARGLGAVVNNSRGILFPYAPEEVAWEEAIVAATRQAAMDLALAAGLK
jgi:orotidine-5'-phosphate decarboxylase